MRQITVRLPDELVAALDEAVAKLHRIRADMVRQAIVFFWTISRIFLMP